MKPQLGIQYEAGMNEMCASLHCSSLSFYEHHGIVKPVFMVWLMSHSFWLTAALTLTLNDRLEAIQSCHGMAVAL
jgi:hypothetical protein